MLLLYLESYACQSDLLCSQYPAADYSELAAARRVLNAMHTAADDGDTPAAVDGTGDGDAGAGDDSTDDDSTDLDLDLGGGEVVIEQGDDSISAGGSLPDDFPGSAVRLPKDFSVLQVQERDSAGRGRRDAPRLDGRRWWRR